MVGAPTSVAMSLSSSADAPAQARRQRWLSVLAKAPAARLAALWDGLGSVPAYALLRRPETGLVMVKGRISGSGRTGVTGWKPRSSHRWRPMPTPAAAPSPPERRRPRSISSLLPARPTHEQRAHDRPQHPRARPC